MPKSNAPMYGPLTDDQVMQSTQQAQMPSVLTSGLLSPGTAAANPVMPSVSNAIQSGGGGADTSDPLYQQVLAGSQQGSQLVQQQLARANQLSSQADAIRQSMAGMQRPITSVSQEPWMKMQPVTGHGFLGGLKNLVGDVAKGALEGVAATGPGQAIQQGIYGPGLQAYEAQKQSKAAQLQEIQQQQEDSERLANVGAQMQYRPMVAGARMQANANLKSYHDQTIAEKQATRLQKGQQFTDREQRVADQFAQSLGIKKEQLSLEQQRTIHQIALGEQKESDLQEYRANSLTEKEMNDEATEQERVYNTTSQHTFGSMLGLTPPAPNVPQRGGRGGNNAPRNSSNSGSQGSNAGGGIQVRDPQGGVHTFKDQAAANQFKKAAGIK